jgi:putative ABC transport system permease protein
MRCVSHSTEAGQSRTVPSACRPARGCLSSRRCRSRLERAIAKVPGVKDVAYANWFGGAYQDPHNQVFSFAVSPNYSTSIRRSKWSAAQRKAFDNDSNGAWSARPGAEIPLEGWRQDSAAVDDLPEQGRQQELDVRSRRHHASKDKKPAASSTRCSCLHWKYFDETTPYNRGQVGWYVTRVTDVNQADRMAKAIDAMSANSDHETKTQTEQAATANWIKQLADIGLIVTSIMGAVFFTLLLLTGNTMMQAVRERTSELAVLKTIGFSSTSVLMMVLAESVLLLLLGGVIGLGLASLLPRSCPRKAAVIDHTSVAAGSWASGYHPGRWRSGLVVGILPAWRAMRLNIVDALAGR